MSKEIYFQKELYNKEAIYEAKNDFAHLMEIKVKEDRDNLIIKTTIKSNDKEVVIKEFKNYVLGLTKQKRL